MFSHDASKENAVAFSRFDSSSPFSSGGALIRLDNEEWKSAEHYVHANLAVSAEYAQKIKAAVTAQEAYKLGNVWYKRKCANWKNLRRVLMTRGLYTQAMMYPEVKQALLATGEKLIVETSAYDHYWGIGRDQRGENTLGKVWMDIRKKIREDAAR